MSEAARAACRAAASLVVAVVLCACAPRGTIVLLPEKDGSPSAVVVKQGDAETVLDKPYSAVRQTVFGPRPYESNSQEVEEKFGAARAAQPARPTSFTLYFVEGKDEYTEESRRIVDGVLSEIAQRPVPDIVVIGHTDTMGTDAINDPLSRKRAETVRADLVRRGVAPENVQAVGRGKRELLVPTPDGVAEPRNRRVEIVVR